MLAETEVKRRAVWIKIIVAVLQYQNKHRGLTPTDEWIAIQCGISRDAVRSELRAMEQAGLLSDSKRWPRLIHINKDAAIDKIMGMLDPKQAAATEGATTKPIPFTESYAFINASPEERAEWRRKGGKSRWAGMSPEQRSQTMRELVSKQWAKLTPEQRAERQKRAAATRQRNKWKKASLAERGAIIRRIANKNKSQAETKEKAVAQKKTDRVEVFKRMPFFERAKQIAHLIDEFTFRTNTPPSGMWLREQIAKAQGVTDRLPKSNLLSVAVAKMVEEGWLDHKAGCHADYRLTNLGRTTLLHSSPVPKEVQKAEPVQIREAASEPRTAHPAIERPLSVTFRGIVPERPSAPAYDENVRHPILPSHPDLSNIDSLDLAMELQRRGWRVMR